MEQRSDGRKPMKKRKPIRRKNRKGRRRLAGFVALLLMIGVVAVLSMTVLFQTKVIVVEGETRYAKEDILRASGLKIGDNLFMQNREEAEQNLPVTLPYLRAAKVKIHLPDQLTIRVEETVPVVAFKTRSGIVLVDDTNKVLDV